MGLCVCRMHPMNTSSRYLLQLYTGTTNATASFPPEPAIPEVARAVSWGGGCPFLSVSHSESGVCSLQSVAQLLHCLPLVFFHQRQSLLRDRKRFPPPAFLRSLFRLTAPNPPPPLRPPPLLPASTPPVSRCPCLRTALSASLLCPPSSPSSLSPDMFLFRAVRLVSSVRPLTASLVALGAAAVFATPRAAAPAAAATMTLTETFSSSPASCASSKYEVSKPEEEWKKQVSCVVCCHPSLLFSSSLSLSLMSVPPLTPSSCRHSSTMFSARRAPSAQAQVSGD